MSGSDSCSCSGNDRTLQPTEQDRAVQVRGWAVATAAQGRRQSRTRQGRVGPGSGNGRTAATKGQDKAGLTFWD